MLLYCQRRLGRFGVYSSVETVPSLLVMRPEEPASMRSSITRWRAFLLLPRQRLEPRDAHRRAVRKFGDELQLAAEPAP
ncbi:MAG: hypothetical protein ACK4NP_12370 [Parvularculaceae bacterium]